MSSLLWMASSGGSGIAFGKQYSESEVKAAVEKAVEEKVKQCEDEILNLADECEKSIDEAVLAAINLANKKAHDRGTIVWIAGGCSLVAGAGIAHGVNMLQSGDTAGTFWILGGLSIIIGNVIFYMTQ